MTLCDNFNNSKEQKEKRIKEKKEEFLAKITAMTYSYKADTRESIVYFYTDHVVYKIILKLHPKEKPIPNLAIQYAQEKLLRQYFLPKIKEN